jgi:quercetin dioxygenase-like cupin family protein
MDVQMTTAVVDGSDFETISYPSDEIWLRAVVHGDVQVTEYRSEDREGPPPHTHEWHEIEYVIEGEVDFFTNGAWTTAGPGSVQLLAAGDAHSVRVPSGVARLLMVTIGAPYDGFARDIASFQAGELAGDLVDVCERHGVRMAGGAE